MAVKIIKGPQARFSHAEVKRAADTKIVTQQPFEIEDEFTSYYESSQTGGVLIAPPFAPLQLTALCTRNNTLQQAVHAMEVNVDGTGHTFELREHDGKEDEGEKKKLEDFFREPFPGMSFITMRRKLRVDMEQLGYGYLEVVRNVKGEMVFLRHVKGSTVRMMKLDEPVEAERRVTRDGKEFVASMWVRERRYCQMLGTKLLYFKEYGASRDIHKSTGKWHKKGELKPEECGGELLRFIVDEDATTPYAVPRWINNLPSVLGSRKAEEFNLDFFDAGGMPPAIIFIQGGSLIPSVREQLLNHLSGKGKAKHRAAVVEVQSSGGTLDASSKVDVKTERFGDARSSDAMFQSYDEKCDMRVRGAFRLPPLFFGRSSDYNFATAVVAYMVTEEQVFQPERHEFDEVINSTVMHELGVKTYRFKSKPITLKNVDVMMKAIELAKDKLDGEHFVGVISEVAGLSLKYSKEAEEKAQQAKMPPGMAPGQPGAMGQAGVKPPAQAQDPMNRPAANTGTSTAAVRTKERKAKSELKAEDIVDLVDDWMVASNMASGSMTDAERDAVLEEVEMLAPQWRTVFNRFLASKSMSPARFLDVAGVDDLVDGCTACLSREHRH